MKFAEILTQYKIPIAPEGHHHSRSGWLQIDCPFHSATGTNKWHLGYNIKQGYLNCWICGSHSLIDTICKLTGISVNQAKKLAKNIKFAQPDNQIKHVGTYLPPKGVSNLLPQHLKYLRERLFCPRSLQRLWQIRGIGISKGFSWRLYIPIYHQGRAVSWTTRAISDDVERRYKSAKEREEIIPHKQILYGGDYVRHACIVTEGPPDVWRIGPGAVGILGLSYTTAQLYQIARCPVRYICFDNEPDAQRRAKKLARNLAVFDGETHIIQLDSADPGCATKKEVSILRKLLK